ncbi:SHOCT domain-containing protein [Methylobacterium sp. WL116]|nr:SHOCT domain-containing protein [Methylobacterium sp. WL116]
MFTKIERLAELHGRGVLTEAEFAEKKADLLSRL